MENVLKLAIFIGLLCSVFAKNPLKEVFSWKKVDFEYADENARQQAIARKEFIPENALPVGVERWKNKLFVTFPRFKEGIPATLTYLDLNSMEKSPKLKPYPNWEAHRIFEGKRKGKIVNVYRVHVDYCDRLWIYDQGVPLIHPTKIIKGNSIYVYDLKTDKLIREYTIPQDQLKDTTWIANIISETSSKDCSQAYAYLPDFGANQLIVYNFQTNESWRVTHHFFHFDPMQGNLNVDGIKFYWQDGIFGMALSPMREDGYSTLYFHPMASTREFSVSTEILRNRTLHEGPANKIFMNIYDKFKNLGSRGPKTQSCGSSFDMKTGVLFYTLVQKNAIGCYNTCNNRSFDASTNPIIAQDNVTMIFPNDLKVDKESTLWVLTDRLPRFSYDHLDYDDINFRIFSGSVEEIIKGTACENSGSWANKESFCTSVASGQWATERNTRINDVLSSGATNFEQATAVRRAGGAAFRGQLSGYNTTGTSLEQVQNRQLRHRLGGRDPMTIGRSTWE